MRVLLVVVMMFLLTGCSVFQDKMNRINGLSCTPPIHSVCEPNESLLICDSADKTECYGKLREEKVWIIE